MDFNGGASSSVGGAEDIDSGGNMDVGKIGTPNVGVDVEDIGSGVGAGAAATGLAVVTHASAWRTGGGEIRLACCLIGGGVPPVLCRGRARKAGIIKIKPKNEIR